VVEGEHVVERPVDQNASIPQNRYSVAHGGQTVEVRRRRGRGGCGCADTRGVHHAINSKEQRIERRIVWIAAPAGKIERRGVADA
jgi:hypothetical protein